MKHKRFFVVIAVFLAAAALAIAAGTSEKGASSKENVKIFKFGANLGLTGELSGYCTATAKGTRLAIDQINEAGGFVVKGQRYKIEYIEMDNRWDPKVDVANTTKLVEQGVRMIQYVGPAGVASQAITEPEKVILIMPGFPAEVTRPGIKYTFATGWSENMLGKAFPKIFGPSGANTLITGCDKLAILTPIEGMPENVYNSGLRKALEAKGISIVFDEKVAADVTDFTTIIAKIKMADPDALLFLNFANLNHLKIYPQMKDAGYQPLVVEVDPISGGGPQAKQTATAAASGHNVEIMYYFNSRTTIPDWAAKSLAFDPEKRKNYFDTFIPKYGIEWDVAGSIHGFDFVKAWIGYAVMGGDPMNGDAIVAAADTETPYFGAMAKTWYYKDTHRFVLPSYFVTHNDIDEKTGMSTVLLLGGGRSTDSHSLNIPITIDQQIDLKKFRAKWGY